MKFLVLLLTSSLLVTSCAYRSGNLSSNISITNPDARTIGIAFGQASTTKVLGFGGISKNSLAYEAKKDLYNHFILKENQVFANIAIEYKYSFYFLFDKTTAKIHAEIIDVNPTKNQANNFNVNSYKNYMLNDTILVPGLDSYKKLRITDFDHKKITVSGRYNHSKKIKYSDYFIANKSLSFDNDKYRIGDNITVQATSLYNDEKINFENCEIIGILNDKALIKSSKNKYFKIEIINGKYYCRKA